LISREYEFEEDEIIAKFILAYLYNIVEMVQINSKKQRIRISPEDIPEGRCKYYKIDDKEYAVCKEEGKIKIYRLKELER